ncbi:MAG: hypothetical protein IKK27_02050 [Alistipes sp.]|nr:hypothetical protein [Alistipes sp.]MBR7115345.1 hypothetical protein [Alistipes sp.]
MKAEKDFLRLIDLIQEGHTPTQAECEYLLAFDERSLEASITRAVADSMARQKFNNKGLVFGQIGVEIAPCPGRCKFCSFSEDFTSFEPFSMSDEALYAAADNFCSSGELFALALMVMHHTPFERTLDVISKVRARIPAKTQIVANLGDFSRTQAAELKAAGANGAYHVWRLGEGCDTQFPATQRLSTIENIKAAGLDLYYCCEPIGPEHTPAQMAEIIMKGLDYECFQHGAMRRVPLAASPLGHYGQISESRLAQITAVVTLVALHSPEITTVGVHEPNKLGLMSGANAIYAETGANPRDTEKETLGNRGLDIAACKQMYLECGFDIA